MVRGGVGGARLLGVLLLVVLGSASAAGGASRRVLVGFRGRPEARVIHGVGGTVQYVYDLVPAIAATVPEAAIAGLAHKPGIDYVEPDYPIYATGAAGPLLDGVSTLFDPDTELLPWGIDRVQAPAVWLGTPPNLGAGIAVAIVDTGIDYTQPDLAANYLGGFDFVSGDFDPRDDNGHGTHVAGTIAALDNGPNWGGANPRGISVVGVGPQIPLLIGKVLDANGVGNISALVAALDVATQYHLKIVSMSLGSTSASTTLQNACANAYAAGVLLVAAAGNTGLSGLDYPARYPEVIAVGAVDSANQRAFFSNYGGKLELCAPGVNVLSTMPVYTVALNKWPYFYRRYYDYLSGTSMSAPHVAGVAALVWAAHPDWTNVQVRDRLDATATDLGVPGRDSYYGFGLVNAAAAAAP